MQLSDHFSLLDAVNSSTAERLGIDNTPSQTVIENAKVAATSMEEVRALLGNLGIHVNSWVRIEELEKVLAHKDFIGWCAKHGKPLPNDAAWAEYFSKKAHPKGYAVDFTCPGYGTPLEIVQAIAASNIKFDQLIAEGGSNGAGGWCHCSFEPQMRGQILTATFKNGAAVYSMA